MPAIYNYLNYREFLHDYYQERKRTHPGFSYQVLANKAGFKSKSFLAHVIDGEKNLSEESAVALGAAINLKEKELVYFELLVAFNQAKTHTQKDQLFSRIAQMNSVTRSRLVSRNQYDFYSRWYHNTIRELAAIIDFKDDFSLLARYVKPRITARQACQSVNLLLRLGMIKKNDGRYVQSDPDITTGDTVQSFAIENFHLQNLNLAGQSLDICPAQQRDLSCMVVGLSQENFMRIKDEIRSFRKKLVQIIGTEKKPDRVYHIAMQLFPTSEPMKERKA